MIDGQLLKRFQRILHHQEVCILKCFELRKHIAYNKVAYAQFVEFFYISVSIVSLCLKGKEETLFRKREPATVGQQYADGAILQVVCFGSNNSDDFFY